MKLDKPPPREPPLFDPDKGEEEYQGMTEEEVQRLAWLKADDEAIQQALRLLMDSAVRSRRGREEGDP